MHHLHPRGNLIRRSFLSVLVMALAVAWGPSIASASTAHKAKKLSMTNVTIANGPNTANGPVFIALDNGAKLFKKYGLNVTWLNTTAGAVSSVTVLLAGSAQFTSDGASAQVQAVQNGAPIRALAQIGLSGPQQIDISQAAAIAHNIPSKGATQAQALKQFKALIGSHLTIAVSSLTSNAYQWFNAAAKIYGLKIGPGAANDVNIVTSGSVPTLVAGFLAGRYDGIINVPPYTLQPNSVQIQYGRIAPLNKVVTNYLTTTITMVQQHPDTVQAFVNAIYAAAAYSKTHPKSSEQILGNMLRDYNATPDTAQQKVLYNYSSPYWANLNPFPTQKDFSQSVNVYNYSLTTPFSVPYNVFVVSHFAKTAGKLFGYGVS